MPEDVSLFVMNPDKYPLLNEVSSYIQTTTLTKGDCLYIPQFYFYQYLSNKDDAVFLSFTYETSSKLAQVFIDAIHAGVLDKKWL